MPSSKRSLALLTAILPLVASALFMVAYVQDRNRAVWLAIAIVFLIVSMGAFARWRRMKSAP